MLNLVIKKHESNARYCWLARLDKWYNLCLLLTTCVIVPFYADLTGNETTKVKHGLKEKHRQRGEFALRERRNTNVTRSKKESKEIVKSQCMKSSRANAMFCCAMNEAQSILLTFSYENNLKNSEYVEFLRI